MNCYEYRCRAGLFPDRTQDRRYKQQQTNLFPQGNFTTLQLSEMKMWSSPLWLRFKQSQLKPEKCFRGFNRNRTHGLCVSAAVLHSGAAVLYLLNWPAPDIWVFIAQLVEHCSANAEVISSNPVEAPKTFFGLTFRLLESQSQLRCRHLHFIRSG